MKTLDEILSQPRQINGGADLKDAYGQSRPSTIARDMTVADFDGIGEEDEYVPGLSGA